MSFSLKNSNKKFFIIGPMRTGTTWIYEYLKIRDDVCLPRAAKELFFFDKYYKKGISWYLNQYSWCQAGMRMVEVSPSYFHSVDAAIRIKKIYGMSSVKFIIIIRDPVSRAISHYFHLKRRGRVKGDIISSMSYYPEIISASLYYINLMAWESFFGKENIAFLKYDDLKTNPLIFLKKLCLLLELPIAHENFAYEGGVINSPSVPFNASIARIGIEFADFLRARNMYWLVRIAKRIGLKKFFFGEGREVRYSPPTEQEKIYLKNLIMNDWERFKNYLYKHYKIYLENEE